MASKDLDLVGWLIAIPLVVALTLAWSALMAWPLALLVNYVLSASALEAMFGGPLDFWHSWALWFLLGVGFNRGRR